MSRLRIESRHSHPFSSDGSDCGRHPGAPVSQQQETGPQVEPGSNSTRRRDTAHVSTQLALPFLTPDDAATVDAARAAVARAHGHALANRRLLEADELERLGHQLVDMLQRNAAAVRHG